MIEGIMILLAFLVNNIVWLLVVLKLIKYIAMKYDIDIDRIEEKKDKELESVVIDDEIEAKIEHSKKRKFLEEEL